MFQYWFSWLFESAKLLLNEAYKSFELCLWIQTIQTIARAFKEFFFAINLGKFFLILLDQEKYAAWCS